MPSVRLSVTLRQAASTLMNPKVRWLEVGTTDPDEAVSGTPGMAMRMRTSNIVRPFTGYRGGSLGWGVSGTLPANCQITSVSVKAFCEVGTISGGVNDPHCAFVDGLYCVVARKAAGGGFKYPFSGGVTPSVDLAVNPHTGGEWGRSVLFAYSFSIGSQYIDNGNQSWIDDSYLDITEIYVDVTYIDLSAADGRDGRGWGAGGWGWGPPPSDGGNTTLGAGGGPGIIDDCECCMAFKLDVINKALGHLGITQVVEDLAEETRERQTADVYYEDDLAATLRSFPWAFATKYLALTLLDGTQSTPINEDWVYMYRYPVDCLMARRLVRDGTGRQFDGAPPTFREGRGEIAVDEQGKVIFSNFEDAILEYTSGESGVECLGDSLFKEAVSWRLAWHMAPGLGRDRKKADECYAMHVRALKIAEAYAANEQQQEQNVDGEASWIRNR